jgi:hypothetical protein
MSSERTGIERLERAVRRQRLAIGGLAGALVLLVAGGQAGYGNRGTPQDSAGVEYPQFAAGGDKLYRISADGRIEYLVVDFAHGTVEGIPGWATVRIDHTLSRDRMGNTIRVRP